MTEWEKYKKEREDKQAKNWKALTPSQKHMTLMYFYRLLTDIAHIRDYVETHRFMSYGINPDDLPDFVAHMTPEQLRAEAYAVIGAKLPTMEAAE